MTAPGRDEERIAEQAEVLLAEGPLSVAELAHRLVEAGVVPTGTEDDVEDVLIDDPRFVEVQDGRWVFGPALVGSVAFLTAVPGGQQQGEEADMLSLDPDLSHLGWLLIEGEPVTPDGRSLHVDDGPEGSDVLHGPHGWLDAYDGGLVAVRLVEDVVHLERLEGTESAVVPAGLVAAAAQVYERWAESHTIAAMVDGEPVGFRFLGVERFWWELLAGHQDLAVSCSPLPPIDVLLTAAGLRRDGVAVVPAAQDERLLKRWYLRNRLGGLGGLDEADVDRAELVVSSLGAYAAGALLVGGDEGEQRGIELGVAAALGAASVAVAVWRTLDFEDTDLVVVAAFAQSLLSRVEGRAAVGVQFLLGKALDAVGEALDAERHLEAAVSTDPGFTPAAQALAAFAADRGDARRAARLLIDSGADDDDPLLEEVAEFAMRRPRPAAARNAPCPCGSGRKYKQCHLGADELHSLEDRAGWLYEKACRYVNASRSWPTPYDIAAEINARAQGDRNLFQLLRDSPIAADLALSEGGLLADFVAERGVLLPADEAALAAMWTMVERSVFEVEAAAEDSLQLRDVRRGERIAVSNTRADPRTRPGMYLMGRPLPVGDTHRAFGGFVPLPDPLLNDALAAIDEGDLDAVVAIVGRSLAPPEIRNSDGHELVLHEITYRVGDRGAAEAALDAAFERVDGESVWHLVRDSANQADTIIAVFALVQHELMVSVNSDERAREVMQLIGQHLPDAELLEDDTDVIDLSAPVSGQGPTSVEDPAMQHALAQFVAGYEQRWLDDQIPALGGLTPRQAAADPVQRITLQRLLRTFPDDGQPGAMSPSRLRQALALPPE